VAGVSTKIEKALAPDSLIERPRSLDWSSNRTRPMSRWSVTRGLESGSTPGNVLGLMWDNGATYVANDHAASARHAV